MTRTRRAALQGLVLAAAVLGTAACADNGYYDSAYGYGYGYDDGYGYGYPYYSGYYGDCFGDPWCGYPVWGGSVLIGGRYYDRPHYRNFGGRREFWANGGWRRAEGFRNFNRGNVTTRNFNGGNRVADGFFGHSGVRR